ncbi:hypothetical protein [Metabacillus niabensis]|uniref:hypothetical protein n=1 Tax=Metabacillus niabensis TaxID=324854 RepID=UPI0039A24E8F
MSDDKLNLELLKKLSGISCILSFNEETEVLSPILQTGKLLTKNEAIEVIKGLMNYIENIDEKEISSHNSQVRRLQDYSYIQFSSHSKKKKKGHVFLYRELVTNTYRFGETKDIDARIEALTNSSPVAIDVVVIFKTDDTISLKEYLLDLYSGSLNLNNWYNLTDIDVENIKGMKFLKGYHKRLERLEQERKIESIVCYRCTNKVTDEMQDGYYNCYYCNSKFCCYECFNEHFNEKHLDKD